MSNDYNTGDALHLDFSNNFVQPSITQSLDCAIFTIEKIVENYPAPYTLMASGGGDSQAMIYAWKLSGKPFKIMSFKYISQNTWYNEHDLLNLYKFCEKHNLQVDYVDLDVIQFLENDLVKNVSRYDGVSPHIAVHTKFTEFINSGTIIYSGNFIPPNTSFFCLDYSVLGLHRFAEFINLNSSKKIIPFFFLHTPELAYSFEEHIFEHTKNEYKDLLYKSHGYDIIIPSKKFTGFELIKDYYDQFFDKVPANLKLKASCFKSRRTFDYLFRYSLEINKVKYTPIYKFLEQRRNS